jgi:type IV secretory pathway VirD2 relaxase
MRDVEKDFGTRLDWAAVDRWNTENPHVHVVIRGRADDGQDLVTSRNDISRAFAIELPSASPWSSQRPRDPQCP